DVGVLAVVPGERLDQIEEQVGLGAGQLDQALAGAVEPHVDRVVADLLEGLVDLLDVFVGGLLLRSLSLGLFLVFIPPVVVENADPKLCHGGPRLWGPSPLPWGRYINAARTGRASDSSSPAWCRTRSARPGTRARGRRGRRAGAPDRCAPCDR